MQNGGARPGAGRKPGVFSPQKTAELKAKRMLLRKVVSKWGKLLDLKMALALGTYKEVRISADGRKFTYSPPPHVESINDLLYLVVGKPKQAVDVDFSTDPGTGQNFVEAAMIRILSSRDNPQVIEGELVKVPEKVAATLIPPKNKNYTPIPPRLLIPKVKELKTIKVDPFKILAK